MAILRKPRRIWNDFKAEKKSCESCVKKHFLHYPLPLSHCQQGKRTDFEEEDLPVEGVQCLAQCGDSEPITCFPKSEKKKVLRDVFWHGTRGVGYLWSELGHDNTLRSESINTFYQRREGRRSFVGVNLPSGIDLYQ